MKIVVIGGSNAILKTGYLSRLRDLLPDTKIVSRAVGATSSMMGYYRLASFGGLEPGDVVLWEYALNDEHEIEIDPAMNVGLALAYAELTLRRTLQKGAYFLPVVFRPRAFTDSSVYSLYRRGLFDLFDRYGIKPIDTSALYAARHNGQDVPWSDYLDPWHFVRESSIPDLAAEGVVSRLMEDTPAQRAILPKPGLCAPDPEMRLVTRFHQLEPLGYSNSLCSETIWRPTAQDVQIFKPLQGVWRMVGVVCLASPEGGSLALRANAQHLPVTLKHRHTAFRKSMVRLHVLEPAQQLAISPEQPLWMLAPATPGDDTRPNRRPMPPTDTGLIGLILERPRQPRTLASGA